MRQIAFRGAKSSFIGRLRGNGQDTVAEVRPQDTHKNPNRAHWTKPFESASHAKNLAVPNS
jgi:hypothetical protein